MARRIAVVLALVVAALAGADAGAAKAKQQSLRMASSEVPRCVQYSARAGGGGVLAASGAPGGGVRTRQAVRVRCRVRRSVACPPAGRLGASAGRHVLRRA